MKLATVKCIGGDRWKVSPYYFNGFEPFVIVSTFELLGDALAARGILAV